MVGEDNLPFPVVRAPTRTVRVARNERRRRGSYRPRSDSMHDTVTDSEVVHLSRVKRRRVSFKHSSVELTL